MQYEFVLKDADFCKIADLIRATTGIVIDERKRAFIHGRLGRRLRTLRLANFSEYCQLLDSSGGDAERHIMANAITTNHTSFFREPHHFDFLVNTVLPKVIQNKTIAHRRLRIWSAGCSTGEEPYTLAITLYEAKFPLEAWDARILATDLDTNVLAKAEAGLYDAESTQSIPLAFRHRYVTMQPDGRSFMNPKLHSLITFKQLNLLNEWPMRGPFDMIFCRNVVIYFDKPTQRQLFDRYADLLKLDGWLIVGHSESLQHLTDRFELVARTVYRKTK